MSDIFEKARAERMAHAEAIPEHTAVPVATQVTVVDGASLPWIDGDAVYDSMEPEFRNNFGGDAEQVRALLAKYSMRSLWLDPESTRRIDHLRAAPGYSDLSEAYHDSVEEAYFLSGSATLSAEGYLQAGDYFWRPPGWVHAARSDEGFENILCMEGDVPSENSGRVSRVVRPDDEAGTQARDDAARAIGPRGYIRRLETRFEVARRHDDSATALESAPTGELTSQTLSVNAVTGAASMKVLLPLGWSSVVPATDRERFLITVDGALEVDGTTLEECSLIHVPAGVAGPALVAKTPATLFVKVGERV
jgi:mannose-6-phosphate isomerase-like protein (cupin superfamily)